LQQVLILGDVAPPGYAVLTFSPILTLNDFVFCWPKARKLKTKISAADERR
jgi:hypothetical protein